METPLPNRLAVYFTGAIALLVGVGAVIGDLDWESTAGVIAALAALAVVVREWLVNWGKWERGEGEGILGGEPEDEFDEENVEPIPESSVTAAQLPEPPPKAS